jgi:GIY-YIG catalytic domain.
MTGVYAIKNQVTGKMYIGSSRCISYRFKSHLSALRSGRHVNKDMQDDFNLYGEENFIFIPLFETSERHKTDLEYFLMEILRTHDINTGYNDKDRGGTGGYLTRSTLREIRTAFWVAHPGSGSGSSCVSFEERKDNLWTLMIQGCRKKKKLYVVLSQLKIVCRRRQEAWR